MWDDGPAAVTVSSYIHGWDETAITDEQLAEIERSGRPRGAQPALLGPRVRRTSARTSISGDIWVAYAWQGCYATALYEGIPVAYANPQEGRNSWVGLYGISADDRQP